MDGLTAEQGETAEVAEAAIISVNDVEPLQESADPDSMSTNEDDVYSSITEHTDDRSVTETTNEVDSMDDSLTQMSSEIGDTKIQNQSEIKKSTKRTVLETVSRRRRKQRMPRRCDRSQQLSQTSYGELNDVAKGLNMHETSFINESIYCKKSGTDKSRVQSHILDKYFRKQQSGFHMKLLHRPYFMKGSDKNKFNHLHLHKCVECREKFPLKKILIKHISRNHAIKLYQCCLCSKQFQLVNSLKVHIKRQHSGEIHRCVKCNQVFTSKGSLKQHRKTHSRDKLYACNLCNRQYNCLHNLNQHLQSHGAICGKQNKSRVLPRKHNRKICQELSKMGIKQHQTVHSDTTHKNNECAAQLAHHDSPIKHTQVHRGVPFCCHICDKQYNTNESFWKHIQCEHSGKTHDFKSKKSKNIQSMIHIGKHSYVCHCGMSFRNRQHLKQHLALHPDQEHLKTSKHFCTQCDMNFCNRSSMLQHMQAKHRKVLLVCPICNMQHDTRRSLRTHVEVEHGMKLTSTKTSPKYTVGNVEMLHAQNNDRFPVEAAKAYVTGKVPLLIAANDNKIDGNVEVSAHPLEVLSGKQYNQMAKMYPQIAKLLKCPFCDKYYRLKSMLKKHISDAHLKGKTYGFQDNDPSRMIQLTSSRGFSLHDDGKEDHVSDMKDLPNLEINDTVGDQKSRSVSLLNKLNEMDDLQTIKDDPDSSTKQSIQDASETQFPSDCDFDHVQVSGDNNNSVLPKMESQDSYVCSVCNSKFSNRHNLDTHIKTHPCCPLCHKSYIFRDSLRKHIKRSHPKHHQKMMSNRKKSSLEKAIQIASKDCVFTPTQQGDSVVMDMGETNSTKQPVLQCPTCNLCFKSEVELHIHEAVHPKCPCCPKQYTLKDSLRKHIKRSHPSLHSEMVYEKRSKQIDPIEEQSFNDMKNPAGFSGDGEVYPGNATLIKSECLGELTVKMEASGTSDISFDDQGQNLLPNHEQNTQVDIKDNLLQNQNQLACPYCSKQYCLKRSLHQHIKRTHGKLPHTDDYQDFDLVCSACNQNFDNLESLHIHKSTHPQCDYCDKVFALQSSLTKHLRNCGKQKFISLLQSTEALNSSKDDENDLPNAHFTQSISQNSSDVSGFQEVEHQQHSNGRGIAQNVFPCSACMIIFDNQEALNFHVKTHLACEFCGKLYTLKDSLRRHIKRSHPEKSSIKSLQPSVELYKPNTEVIVKADTCSKESSTDKDETKPKKENLKSVEESVDKENGDDENNLCPVCFLVFDNDDAYKVHVKIHPMCEACGKMYRLKDSLKKHIQRSHPVLYEEMKERKQEADQTDMKRKKCKNHDSLSRNGEDEASASRQVFSCPACQLVFDTEELLDDHVSTHPACKYCGKAYKLIDSLRKHIKRSHPDEEFKRQSGQDLHFSNDGETYENQVYPSDIKLSGDLHPASLSATEQVDFVDKDGTPAQGVHSAARGDPVSVVYRCPAIACSVIFNSKEALASHVITHYSCIHCGKLYSIRSSFLKHMQRSHPSQHAVGEKQGSHGDSE